MKKNRLDFTSCQGPGSQENLAIDSTEISNIGVKHLEWTKNTIIYEVNLRQYSESGSFKEFAEQLPRLKKLGIDILWIMPIYPIGEKNRKGTMGSYYSVRDYYSVNPEHGTLNDFIELVKKIHKMGMYVILDWVPNHTSWDNKLTIDHPEWYKKDSLGNFVPPVPDWSDVIHLDYNSEGLRKYMIEALKYWIQKTDIDGYRCDVAHMIPTDFWNEARVELDKVKPVFMLAEAEIPEHHDEAFDMSYAWEFYHIMNEIVRGKKTALDVDAYFEKTDSTYPKDAYRMYFTSNHDENSWNGTVKERLGEGAKAFTVLTFTVPGMPLIYSGQEADLNKRLEFFEKDVIEWKDHDLSDFYSVLINLKKKNKALWNGEHGGNMTRVHTSNDQAIFSFITYLHTTCLTVFP